MSLLFIGLLMPAAVFAARAAFVALRSAHRLTTPAVLQELAAGRPVQRLDERGLVAARLAGVITPAQYQLSMEWSLLPLGAGRAPSRPVS